MQDMLVHLITIACITLLVLESRNTKLAWLMAMATILVNVVYVLHIIDAPMVEQMRGVIQ